MIVVVTYRITPTEDPWSGGRFAPGVSNVHLPRRFHRVHVHVRNTLSGSQVPLPLRSACERCPQCMHQYEQLSVGPFRCAKGPQESRLRPFHRQGCSVGTFRSHSRRTFFRSRRGDFDVTQVMVRVPRDQPVTVPHLLCLLGPIAHHRGFSLRGAVRDEAVELFFHDAL